MKQFFINKWFFIYIFFFFYNSFCQYPFIGFSSTLSTETVTIVVSGAAINSGTYHISRNKRVLDAIKAANNNIIPDLSVINCRAITISTPDSTQIIDLLEFLNTGNLMHNPFLSDGMHIHLNYAVQWINISGELDGALVGKVPIAKDETYGKFLSLYTFRESADTNHIFIQRTGYKAEKYSLSQVKNTPIKNHDNLTIFTKSDQSIARFVQLSGEVLHPGKYNIVPEKTLASSVIELGGGATTSGDIKRAYVIRHSIIDTAATENIVDGMESVRPEIAFGVNHAIKSNDYAVFPLGEGPVLLERGDEIIVPVKDKFVYVSGEVKIPGPILFKEGRNLRYYIEQAGGYTKKADRRNRKVITYYGKSWRSTDKENITKGDIIIIPQVEENKKFNKFVTVLQILMASITTTLTVLTFYENWE
jgi:protein involved in polysaccharide export with SLBB domain